MFDCARNTRKCHKIDQNEQFEDEFRSLLLLLVRLVKETARDHDQSRHEDELDHDENQAEYFCKCALIIC